MPPADPAAKAVEAWAMIGPKGGIVQVRVKVPPYLKARDVERGWRIAKVSITEITPQHGGDDE